MKTTWNRSESADAKTRPDALFELYKTAAEIRGQYDYRSRFKTILSQVKIDGKFGFCVLAFQDQSSHEVIGYYHTIPLIPEKKDREGGFNHD